MFRLKSVADSAAIFWITIGLLLVMFAATVATVWMIAEVRKEQRAIGEILASGDRQDFQRLGSLPNELKWQFVLTVLVLLVLIAAACLLVFVVRALLTSRATLRDIRVLAWDILASMDHAVVTIDRAGCLTTINPAGIELLGLTPDCEGRSLRELCGPEMPLADISDGVLRSGQRQHDHDFSVVHHGHQLRLRADGHILRDAEDNVAGTVLNVRDVTESQLIEESMRRMERFMGLGSLAAGLHHEINNPLSALLLHVRLLEERLNGQTDDDITESMQVLQSEITRIAAVLHSFRDYASIDQLSRSPTDVIALVQQTLDLVRPQADQQKVHVDVEWKCSLKAISADASRLGQMLLNLVLNALDAMPSGGTLRIVIDGNDDEVTIDVADTGRGIADNVRARVFDPYFTTKSHGSGMGLAFCDKIVREHGGQIDVTTNRSGTVFRVILPVHEP